MKAALLLLFLQNCIPTFVAQLDIASATARTLWSANCCLPHEALDDDPGTSYHSGVDSLPEWLKLNLGRTSYVEKVVLVNRYNANGVLDLI